MLYGGVPRKARKTATETYELTPNDYLWRFDASDITKLWQDTSGTTQVTAPGQAVARWDAENVGSMGYIIDGGSVDGGPAYVVSPRKGLSFNGSDEYLYDSGPNVPVATGISTRTTLAVVSYMKAPPQTAAWLFSYGNLSPNQLWSAYVLQSNSQWVVGVWDGVNVSSGVNAVTDNLQVLGGKTGGGTIQADVSYTEGTPSARGTTPNTIYPLHIGVRCSDQIRPTQAIVHEVIEYGYKLSTAQWNSVVAFLLNKWAL